jgi:23S rRNA pseudouridine1911/1915/1917 synthase
MDPTVIYEDNDIIVVNKPAGLAVHADGKHERATLVDWLLVNYPEIKGVGEEQIHRQRFRILFLVSERVENI